MSVTVRKSVLENFIKKIVENRTGGDHDVSKVFDVEEDTDSPIKPQEMMSMQLAAEAPPVDDPEYVPSSTEELGRSAQIIAQEVPDDQIEKAYRALHRLLDQVIDDHNDNRLEEAIRFFMEANGSPGSRASKLAAAAQRAARGVPMRNLASQYLQEPEFADMSYEEFQDALQDEMMKSLGQDVDTPEASAPSLAPVAKPGTLGAFVGDEEKHKAEIEKAVSFDDRGAVEEVDSAKILDRKLAIINRASSLAQLPEDVGNFEGLEYLVRVARTWEFSDKIPYLDVVFLSLFGLHELSYMVTSANYQKEYGGLQLAPRDTGYTKQMTITKVDSGPSSKAYSRGILADIQEKYGMNYDNNIHIRNLSRMSDAEIKKVVVRALMGMARYNNIANKSFSRWADDPGDKLETVNNVVNFLADLFVMTYKQELRYEKRQEIRPEYEGLEDPTLDFVDMAINRYFSPVRKGKAPYAPPYFYTDQGFMNNAHEHADDIMDIYPGLILDKMRKKYFKKRLNKFVIKHDQMVDVSESFTEEEMLSEIENFVRTKIQASIDMHEEGLTDAEDEELGAEPTEAELEGESEEIEMRKILKELEKRANPITFTHIAPYFGFSGESGVRQWMLKFPERRIRLSMMGKDSKNPGIKEFRDRTNDLYEHLVLHMPEYLEIQIEQIETEIEEFETQLEKGVVSGEKKEKIEKALEFGRNYAATLKRSKDEIEGMSMALSDSEYGDLTRAAFAVENDEPIPNDILARDEFIEESLELWMAGTHSVGGIIVRSSLGDPMNKIIKNVDKPWHDKIIEALIEEPYNLDPKLAKKFSEHFTGKKNVPNFERMKSTAREMVAAGINSDEFFEMYEMGYQILDKILEERFGLESEEDAKSDKKKPKEFGMYKKIIDKFLEINLTDPKIQGKEKEKMLAKAEDLYFPLVLQGLKEFDNMYEMEMKQKQAKKEAEEFKEKINESVVVQLNKIIEALL